MAISFVGSTSHQIAGAGREEVTLPGTPASGDIVLVGGCTDTDASLTAPDDGSVAYTAIGSSSANDPSYGLWYKVLSGSDSSVFITGLDAGETSTFVVAVFRGIDTGSPFDATSTVASNSAGDPDPPSITTVTNDAAVLSWGFLDDDGITSCTQSGGSNVTFRGVANECSTMFGWQTQATAGAVNPAAFVTDGDDAWFARTVALKPAAGGGSVASASGTGTASAVGRSNAAATASASGAGAATGVGRSTAKAVGSASGTGSAAGIGRAAVQAVGSAAGTSTVAAVGISTAKAAASASGTGTASGVSTATAKSAGSASGTGTATGIGSSLSKAAGSASGTGTASAVGASLAKAVGSASGTGTAEAVGSQAAEGEGVGTASGTSTATAVGASLVAAVANAAGTSTAVAVGTSEGGEESTTGAGGLTQRELALLLRLIQIRQQRDEDRRENLYRQTVKDLERAAAEKREKTQRLLEASPVAEDIELPPPPPKPVQPPKQKARQARPEYDFAAAQARMAELEVAIVELQRVAVEMREREDEEDDLEALLLLAA
jgi:hypothetical protein